MCKSTKAALASMLMLLFACIPAAGQVTTGSITGTVTDNTGSVMPGTTASLSGETLIGGVQTQVADATGTYRFDRLPPGAYTVKFELQGFKGVTREDIRVSASFTATINVKLEVGQIEETITVTGESPTVDTKSNVQQTVMGQDTLEGLPTGRDVWSMAKIIPGLNVSTYDVGGTQGMQASGLSAHGSSGQTFAVDGLAVNWPGGSTMLYYDQGMFEEVNYQTSAMPAEVQYGGVFMNMVTKAGGNKWKGEFRSYYANENMQAENFADVSAKYQFPGGNPVKKQYDINASVSGALMQDKVWFFGSFRRWRVDKIWKASFNPDGSNALDDNLIWNGSGKITTQLNSNHRIGILYNYNQKDRFHRRGTSPAFVEEKATSVQLQPGYATQAKYTAVLGGSSVIESTVGLMAGVYPERYQKEVTATDYRREDTVLSTATGAAASNYENPNWRFQFDNVFSHTRTGLGGTHSLKGGFQYTRMRFEEITRRNGDWTLIYTNRVPTRITAYNTPTDSVSYVQQLGFFAQDAWSAGKHLTLNLGLRVDQAKGWWPDQTSPAGRFVGARTLAAKTVYQQWRPAWRTGLAYDLFGDGRTAIKASFSRYANVLATGIVTSVHKMDSSSQSIAWTDVNGNNLPDANELGAFEGFTGGATTRYSNPNGPAWPYSDEATAGVEHQLLKNLRLGVMYYHRTNRQNLGTRNAAVPASAYTAATIANPLGGTVTVYNLNASYVGLQDNVRDNIPELNTTYDGVEVTTTKRFTNRWQMLFGFTAGKNVGGTSYGDFNDPNNLVFQQGRVGSDATYSTKLSGSYLVPVIDLAVSGSFVNSTGYPRQFTYSVTRSVLPTLVRSSQTIRVNANGDERRPNVSMIDMRFSRPFKFKGGRSIEPQFDVFNLTNSDVIVNMVDALGPRLGYPTEILAPRIVRVGIAVRF